MVVTAAAINDSSYAAPRNAPISVCLSLSAADALMRLPQGPQTAWPAMFSLAIHRTALRFMVASMIIETRVAGRRDLARNSYAGFQDTGR
jgi:hypothetical protein